MQRVIILEGIPYPYELTRKRVKNINLRVRRDGSIAVSCNSWVSVEQVERFMKANSSFIIEALAKTRERADNAERPQYCKNGDKVKVFGQEYEIRVIEFDRNMVRISEPYLLLCVKDKNDERLRQMTYEKWRRKTLRDEVINMCRFYYPFFERLGVKWPVEIRFRSMKSRWGSCIPTKGKVTFNYNLFEAPREACEYVVVHEFAHFLQQNHSAAFYKIVGSVLPDYKIRRSMLSEY